jgi:general secretion pathway protein F
VEGRIEAETQEDALNNLASGGLVPFFIEQEALRFALPGRKKRISDLFNFNRRAKVSSAELLLFTGKLTTLIRARVELLSALYILYDQYEPSRAKDVVFQVYSSVKEGKNFSAALENFQEVFSSFYISMIRAGEASGRLDLSLEQISEFLSRKEKLKAKVMVALAYPVLLVCVGSASIFVLINWIVPRLSGLLLSVRGELPLITRCILSISDFSRKTSFFVLPVLFFAVFFLLWRRNDFIRAKAVAVMKKTPWISTIFLNQELANFSWSLSLLLKSGVPLFQSLKVASRNIADARMAAQLDGVCDQLRLGETFSRALGKQTSLPQFFIKMISIGEESGRLPEVLNEISQSYARDVESALGFVSALLEPCLILVLGSVMGLIVFSIMLPLFQVTQSIQ